MANTFAPFGFRKIGVSNGAAPTFALSKRRIASGNSTAIYLGDPVMPVVSSANGYITQGVVGTTRLDGIFWGCKYLSVARKQTVWSNYWPGSDANGDVEAYVIDDPNARFVVQVGPSGNTTAAITGTVTSFTSSKQGQYANFALGTGSTATGVSGAYLDASTINTTVTLPFIITDYVTDPPGSNGADPTSANLWVIVGFNNEILRSNGAGPTGIA
jgi:hypothetical protein